MHKKIALGLSLIILAAPLAASALSVSDLEAELQDLLGQLNSLQSLQVSQPAAAASAVTNGTTTPTGTISITGCTASSSSATCPVSFSWKAQNTLYNGAPLTQVNVYSTPPTQLIGGGTAQAGVNYFRDTANSGSASVNLAPGNYLFNLYGYNSTAWVLLQQQEITIAASQASISPGGTNSASPTCSMSEVASGTQYGLTWTSQNATSAHLSPIPGMGAGWVSVQLSNSNPANWTGAAATYTLTVYGSNGAQATCTASAPPVATITQSSLTTTSSNPTISGTAANLPYPYVTVAITVPNGLSQSLIASVSNGTWSASFNGNTLPEGGNIAPGAYSVVVSATNQYKAPTTALASGTLTVNSTSNSGNLTSTQISAIISLLRSFGMSDPFVNQIQAILGETSGGITSIGACPMNAEAYRGENGAMFSCTCPANISAGAVWGGGGTYGYYTDSSSICSAGAQVGQMNLASGGEVDFTIEPGQSSYTGRTVYGITSQSLGGITSQSLGAWAGSFAITGPKG